MDSSHSNNSVSSDGINTSGPPRCFCGKKTTILKSWTFDNPGRRFVLCDTHGFQKWLDLEPPHGWQQEALREARDEISRLKKLNKSWKDNCACFSKPVVDTDDDTKKLEKAEKEIMVSNAKETMMRQFLVISWVGFVAVTAIIIAMMK